MIETFAVKLILPEMTGGIEQVHGADHIGVYKIQRGDNGPVHMAFRRQVDHRIRLMQYKNPLNGILIQYIRFFKKVIGRMFNIPEIFQVTGIGKGIEVDDLILRVFGYKETDYV